MAGRLAADLPAALRDADPSLNLVFGALHAGDAANVIPATAMLRGTLRTPDRAAWDAAPARLDAALRSLVGTDGCDLRDRPGPRRPAGRERRAGNGAARGAAAESSLGPAAVVPTEQSAGGDDFAWYAELVPSTYARLGVHDPSSTGPRRDLHASTFDVDERAIAVGVRVLVGASLAAPSAPP